MSKTKKPVKKPTPSKRVKASPKKPAASKRTGKKLAAVGNDVKKLPKRTRVTPVRVEEPPAPPARVLPTAPRKRDPFNYPKIVSPAGPCPVTFQADPPIGGGWTDGDVLDWAERLRDHYESRHQYLHVDGLLRWAASAIGSKGVEDVRRLYAEELEAPERDDRYYAARNLPVGSTFVYRGVRSPVMELVDVNECECKVRDIVGGRNNEIRPIGPGTEVVPGNRQALLYMASMRGMSAEAAKDPTKPHTTPPANASGPRVARTRVAKTPKPGGYDPTKRLQEPPNPIPNKTKLPVEWVGSNGKHSAKVFGVPIRPLAAWMGADGWSNIRAKAAFTELGLADYPDIDQHVIAAHCSAGRKAAAAGLDKTTYGKLPKIEKKQADALRAIAKEV